MAKDWETVYLVKFNVLENNFIEDIGDHDGEISAVVGFLGESQDAEYVVNRALIETSLKELVRRTDSIQLSPKDDGSICSHSHGILKIKTNDLKIRYEIPYEILPIIYNMTTNSYFSLEKISLKERFYG